MRLLRARHRHSLQRTLLVVLAGGMLVVLGVELALAWRTAADAADAAYDRSLLGAIKSIDANISTASGGLGVELPYRMLEFFELTASGQVFFRVATEDGLVEIGDTGLPLPAQPLVTGQPQFTDTAYLGTPVRMGSYARTLEQPLAGLPTPQRVVIQVAETRGSRAEFTGKLLWQALWRDLALIGAALLLLVGAVRWAMRPLTRLSQEVEARPPQDMTAVATAGIPAEVRPLVAAINQHIDRNRRMVEARRRFIDDASHQLRTPLTTLGMQLAYAQRETDPALLRGALGAVKQQLDETIRQTNQMLTLARADSMELVREPLDLVAFAGELTRSWWREACERDIDLGLEAPSGSVWVLAHHDLLREAVANLLHNAIRYTPVGGHVTVRVSAAGGQAVLEVLDSGPGIPPAERPRAGERFFRASNASQPGSGLGLAIARSIAERHRGRLELDAAPGGGLVARVVLPPADPATAPAAG